MFRESPRSPPPPKKSSYTVQIGGSDVLSSRARADNRRQNRNNGRAHAALSCESAGAGRRAWRRRARCFVYGDDIGHDATVSGEAPRIGTPSYRPSSSSHWRCIVARSRSFGSSATAIPTLSSARLNRSRKTVDGRFDLVLELLVADAHSTAFLVIEQSPCPPRSGGCPGTIGSSLTPCSKHRTAWNRCAT